ncbi:MAG: hypothetical protein WCI95_10755 [bacterium]
MKAPATLMRRINAVIIIGAAVWFFILPGAILTWDLTDPALRQPTGIPRAAWRVHKHLTPRYEKWARERIASGEAMWVNTFDVAATEWAMFGSVFYLAATENLQKEWARQPGHPADTAPAVYARGAIEAATDLVLDPTHHTWVKTHWGPNYLHRENVFFRAMLIQTMISRENLIHDGRDLALLRDQVETLSAALDASPHGILNDYPEECYPIDVFATVAMIRRADALLGTDHRAFAERERRAFQGTLADAFGLPGYFASPETGLLGDPSRGIGNSYVLIYCPELYPDWASKWYDSYVKGFWQQRLGATGFREYARDIPNKDWFFDIDAGPVMAGFGPAANAYGVAAARANGRFDDAWTLSSQVLAASWPLLNGTWFGARMLSNAAHAPYLGEANLLFLFTTLPTTGTPIRTGGTMPPFVYGFLVFYFGIGLAVLLSGLRTWRQASILSIPVRFSMQFALWGVLLFGGLILTFTPLHTAGLLMILGSQFLPRKACATATEK